MANEVSIEITGTETVSDTLETVSESAHDTEVTVTNAMGSTEEAFDTAARSSGRFGSALDTASGAGSQLAGGLDTLSGGIQAVTDLQNHAANKARALARAQLDVEQAMVDGEQAAIDLRQAELDLDQAHEDLAQSGIDAKQAQIDQNQATIDAKVAQEEYNKAVKENGPNSVEALQAANDLKQANLDLEQANQDLAQASQDAGQAQNDMAQATADAKQANVDAKGSALDLAEAQSEVATQSSTWGGIAEQAGLVAPVIMSMVGAIDLLILANTALNASFLKNAASMVSARIAIMASAVATGVATAAQWLWNLAMTANPIGLIIVAVMALIGVIILIATKTTWFQDLWNAVWGFIGEPVKAAFDFIVGYYKGAFELFGNILNWFKNFFASAFKFAIDFAVGYFKFIWALPGQIFNVFRNVGNAIFAPFKWAFNMISWAWNNTAGRLSFRIPGWVPGIGGNGFSMPRLPSLAVGGDVLRSGLAMIHKGERIIPASAAPLGTTGGGEMRLVIDLSSVPDDMRAWVKKMTRGYGGRGPNAVQIAWSDGEH